MSNLALTIVFLLAETIPFAIIGGSIVLIIAKIIERKKEKKNEHFDRYDRY
ncbi:hypothetical protein [Romboutsia sp. MSSM.1001216sp_RTP31141st1_G3_RTP31141_220114]|uniref:hypothetical protein n=1 Tax=unclassified Romboutsia TaxID=2626894 RepID=UPI0031B64EA8